MRSVTLSVVMTIMTLIVFRLINDPFQTIDSVFIPNDNNLILTEIYPGSTIPCHATKM